MTDYIEQNIEADKTCGHAGRNASISTSGNGAGTITGKTVFTPPIPPPLIGNEGFGVYPNVTNFGK